MTMTTLMSNREGKTPGLALPPAPAIAAPTVTRPAISPPSVPSYNSSMATPSRPRLNHQPICDRKCFTAVITTQQNSFNDLWNVLVIFSNLFLFILEKCKHPTMAHRPYLLLKQFGCAAVEKENYFSVFCKESGHLLTAYLCFMLIYGHSELVLTMCCPTIS